MSLLSPQLQAFIAITQHKTVHGAAHAVHVTQTAVTQRIRALEARLGATLFIRTRRGMMLTTEGEALLRYCHAVREIEGEALAKINGAGTDSTVRLCVTGPSSIMRSRIIPQCSAVMKKFPGLLLQFAINDLDDRVKSLRAGESQLAVIALKEVTPEMQHKILKPERYVLVCARAWQRRRLAEIIKSERIVDYEPSDQMTFNYLKQFKLLVDAKHERHFANRTDALAALLVAGVGYGVLTTEFSKPYVEQKQLIVLNAARVYENSAALAWYARPEPPKYFSALINAIG